MRSRQTSLLSSRAVVSFCLRLLRVCRLLTEAAYWQWCVTPDRRAGLQTIIWRLARPFSGFRPTQDSNTRFKCDPFAACFLFNVLLRFFRTCFSSNLSEFPPCHQKSISRLAFNKTIHFCLSKIKETLLENANQFFYCANKKYLDF